MATNLRRHEIIGLFLIFAGATWLGFGVYGTLVAGLRFLVSSVAPIGGKEILFFPLFYGLGALLIVLGQIELKGATPGKNRGML
ncbi:MAG: hypothetical protein HYT16_00605 [DPANN group archaeon]|nr:hypothetical protein [DPANN group archaeon]